MAGVWVQRRKFSVLLCVGMCVLVCVVLLCAPGTRLYAQEQVETIQKSETIKWVETPVLNGKATIRIPSLLSVMPKAMLSEKYPGIEAPVEAYSDFSGSVSIALSFTDNQVSEQNIPQAKIAFSRLFRQLYPSADWIRDEIIEQNGRQYIVLEMITPAKDAKIHNLMYGISLEGRLLMVSFNTTLDLADTWLRLGEQSMQSLQFVE
ncbi:hypothetical protein OLMES_4980 [Oleiphilus messinensis]|uniref:Lipoprotein n=1 Tax=Oleiphilus messinensis TaxID=141451 RepID=A0A1Y0IEL1_9GAMM|nr:hypothetical protein [Oleiphilus messinensis]ARU58967.1 hypothetical protein OLMES_4980 [Oleiphilus messinensis]